MLIEPLQQTADNFGRMSDLRFCDNADLDNLLHFVRQVKG